MRNWGLSLADSDEVIGVMSSCHFADGESEAWRGEFSQGQYVKEDDWCMFYMGFPSSSPKKQKEEF
jgi:hypothetical protein